MIDWNKIKKLEESGKRNKAKLEKEVDYKKKEIIRLKLKIDEIKIKIEKLN